ncbi:uncharacterized protein FTOL_02524 [Fusarium torulosum]|uniref:Uncharacterized protein n=1 Tax=Fusarium torulosum TaxID=33205 RepID=A0AAE8SED4_9HYPO|nr:uncharacterized protein FTOL_02524 [Fusarium torulosum]
MAEQSEAIKTYIATPLELPDIWAAQGSENKNAGGK